MCGVFAKIKWGWRRDHALKGGAAQRRTCTAQPTCPDNNTRRLAPAVRQRAPRSPGPVRCISISTACRWTSMLVPPLSAAGSELPRPTHRAECHHHRRHRVTLIICTSPSLALLSEFLPPAPPKTHLALLLGSPATTRTRLSAHPAVQQHPRPAEQGMRAPQPSAPTRRKQRCLAPHRAMSTKNPRPYQQQNRAAHNTGKPSIADQQSHPATGRTRTFWHKTVKFEERTRRPASRPGEPAS